MLLLHGAGQTRHSWRTTGSVLAEAGWHAIALDLRGHGDSERSAGGHYRLGDFADDVTAVSQSLPTPPVLVGASLGGLAALSAVAGSAVAGAAVASLAVTTPALVLVDISVEVEREGSNRVRRFMTAHSNGFPSLEAAAAAIEAFSPDRTRPTNLNGLRKNLRRRPDGRWFWHWDPRIMDGSPRSLNRLVADPGGEPVLAHHLEVARAAPSITVPTLLIRGLRSELVSERSVQALHEVIPHATHLDVAEAGHMIVGDRNDVFTASLVSYLGRLRADRHGTGE